MSTCPSCINTSCPAAGTEVSLTTNNISVEAAIETERYEETGFSGTTITLASAPNLTYDPMVYVNGVLSRAVVHYTYAPGSTTITFLEALTDVDIVVIYVAVSV
jgi:hypothetical protein